MITIGKKHSFDLKMIHLPSPADYFCRLKRRIAEAHSRLVIFVLESLFVALFVRLSMMDMYMS